MNVTKSLITTLLCCCYLISFGQSEEAIKIFFEGKKIVPLIDLPATQQGISIYPEKEQKLKFDDYGNDIKENGVGAYANEAIMITKLVVKKNHIRFELGGGGYGGFWDESDHVSVPTVAKSERELELEQLVRDESDRDKKNDLKRELQRQKRDREQEQARLEYDAEQAKESKRQRIAEKRRQAGSRLHLRYDRRIETKDLGVDKILDNLSEFALLEGEIIESSQPNTTIALKKGINWNDVNTLYGMPIEANTSTDCELTVMTCKYDKDNEVLTAKFVEGILVSYAISSR